MYVIGFVFLASVILIVVAWFRESIWTRPPDLKEETDDAIWFKKDNLPDAHDEYDTVLEYAKELYEESNDTFDALDKKSELLFGISATIGTLLAVMARNFHIEAAFLLPSLLLLLVTMSLSLRSRMPIGKARPITVRECLTIMTRGARLKPRLLKSYHLADSKIALITHWKAHTLEKASSFFFAALFSIFVVMMIVAYRGPPESAPKPATPSVQSE